MSDTKNIVITGAAAESMYDTKSKKGGNSRKRKDPHIQKLDGAGMSPGTMDQLASTRVPGLPVKSHDIPVQLIGAVHPNPIGGQSQKVILSKTAKVKKVFLSPPTKKSSHEEKKKTVKRVSVNGINRKLRRAKTIKKKSKDTPLETIKKKLVDGGLVKADTKAPEDVLRQMHSDFMVLQKKAL